MLFKKIFSFLFVLALGFTLFGCEEIPGGGGDVTPTGSRTLYTDELKLANLPTASSAFDTDGVCYATLVRNVDGDTTYFKATVGGKEQSISVRYLGVDTPESTYQVDPWGIAAAKFTASKLNNAESIVLQSDPTGLQDSNNRFLGWVWYRQTAASDYRLLNLEIIEEGYSASKSVAGKIYESQLNLANNRAQKYKDRTNGEKDPTYDYDKKGLSLSLKQIIERYGTAKAIESEEYKGVKVYIEGIISRKLGASSAYIEQVDTGYYDANPAGGDPIFHEGDGKTYGMYLYGGFSDNTYLERGNYITTSANVSYHSGSLQLVGVANRTITVVSSGNVTTPVVVTANQLNLSTNPEFKFRLVQLDNLKVTGGKDDAETEAYTIYTEAPDGTRINIRVDANVALKLDGMTKNTTWEAFKDVTFTSVIGIAQPYFDNYQIMVTRYLDLTYNK